MIKHKLPITPKLKVYNDSRFFHIMILPNQWNSKNSVLFDFNYIILII